MTNQLTKAARQLVAALVIAGIASGAGAQTVVSGQATFQQQGNLRTITNTPGAIIQWPGFSIAAGDTTRFVQQSASSTVLNRITGQEPSRILGALESNGRVVLVNPNGVLFGAGSRVDVQGLVASSLNISNSDFLAGKLNFSAGATAGKVVNQGRISTPEGGQVVLIAPDVENNGVIHSPGGDVLLAAGRSVKLADTSNPALHVVVSAPADQAVNLGRIVAQGGRIGIYGGLVSQRGLVNADSAAVGANGQIVFKAGGDLLLENGSTTSARGAGAGGTIHLLGDRVGLTGNAKVDASGETGGGTVLAGGDYQGKNPTIANAQQVFVGKDASIAADALQSGNGGKVIAWSDGTTRMHGSISARGGAQSGDGGFVEVSGRTLDMQGLADTRAPKGRMGTLLLDPTNIFIADDAASAGMPAIDTSANTPAGGLFAATGAVSDSLLTVATLQGLLGGSMVTVSTANGAGGGAGMITVVNPVTWASDTGLTLSADAGISINANITGGNGSQLTLNTTAGNISQTGRIAVTTLSANANAGSVNLTTPNEVRFLSGSGATGFTYNGGDMATTIQGGGITTQGNGPVAIQIAGNLTVNGPISSAAGNITVSSDSVFTNNATIASASGNITVQGAVVQASLAECTVNPALANCAAVLPSLATCTANPALPGCSAVLPSLATCIATPAMPGCSAVLPSLATCTAAPTTPGCSVVLPSLAACIAAPATAGCSAVLPSIATCTAAPATPGCSVVLPSLAACTAAPTTPGCSAVLPSIAACTAAPATAGCTAVLPSLAVCTAAPATAGCSVVLPSLAACTAAPSTPGCSAVLPPVVVAPPEPPATPTAPTLPVCVAAPGTAGCTAVLPSITACVATPTAPGCSVVLPGVAACLAAPNTAGCSVVLPTVAQCSTSPSIPGCSAVLPSLSRCIAAPSTAGCSAILPSLSSCAATPSLAGCSVVLPTLAACTALPTQQGCSAVLPSMAGCTANPAAPGCSAVLPSLATCVTAPTTSGCSVVLPTVSQCLASPNLAGCAIVTPSTANVCITAPNSALCQVLSPPTASEPDKPATQVANEVIRTVNNATGPAGAATSGGGTKPDDKKEEKKDDQKESSTVTVAAKKDEPAKKMYCN